MCWSNAELHRSKWPRGGKLRLESVCVAKVQKLNQELRFHCFLNYLYKGHGLICGGHLYF